MLAFSWGDVGVEGLALSLGVTPPVGFGAHAWPTDGAQRYTIQNGRFFFLSYGAGIAYQFGDYLSIGANFLAGAFTADFEVATRQGSSGVQNNENLEDDNRVDVEVSDPFVPSGAFGALSRPIDWLELGLSVRLPFASKATGTFEYTPGELTPDAVPASKPYVELKQTFPTVVRAGARYIHEVFDLEVDFVFENYARVDRIDVRFSNPDGDINPAELLPASPYDDPNLLYLDSLGDGTVYTAVIATPVPLNFRDTYSVRVGSDVNLVPGHLTVRGGGFWASSAYPPDYRTMSIRFPFTEQIGIGGGLTWHAIPQLDVSAGYLHIFQPTIDVTDGVAQANAFRQPDDPTILANIVNNGRYSASLDIFGLELSAHFTRRTRRHSMARRSREASS
jgi:long-subunit fatty acid transport protein